MPWYMLGYFMKQKSLIFEECKCLLVGQIMATSHFIENLPPEIVLCLLKYLSLSDILNFYQAYNLWHELIAQFFMKPQMIALTAIDSELKKLFLEEGWTENCNDLSLIMTLWEKYKPYKAKILVTTGNPIGNGQKIEIIDLDNFHFKCELMADSLGRGGSVGGLLDNQPIICGGNSNSNEFESGIILGHHNKKVQTIEPNRAYASSVVLDNTALWIVGGDDGYFALKSTEFVRVDQEPVKGPDLGFSIKKHCMIQINSFTIFIIGGWLGGGNKSTATWVVDPSNNFRLKEGPSLNVPRNGHSCSKMTINGRVLIVVAGGSDGQSCLDSVEILDLNYPVWIQGPKLPFPLYRAAMVTSPCGKGVVIIGGAKSYPTKSISDYSDSLIKLSGNSVESLAWTILDKKLQFGRKDHIAFPIPDQLLKQLPTLQSSIKEMPNT